MRIGLYNGSTLYPLAGASGVSERVHSSAGGFVLTPESAVQVAAFVRGTYAKPIDRGNILNVLSFSTSRLFASPAEAQLWCLDYHSTIPSSGTLYFDAISPAGVVTRRTMADTVVDPPRRRCNGATALLDYTVRGGIIAVGVTGVSITGTLSPDATGLLLPYETAPFRYSSDGEVTAGGVYPWIDCWFDLEGDSTWNISYWDGLFDIKAWKSDVTTAATPDLATGWAPISPATGTPVVTLV